VPAVCVVVPPARLSCRPAELSASGPKGCLPSHHHQQRPLRPARPSSHSEVPATTKQPSGFGVSHTILVAIANFAIESFFKEIKIVGEENVPLEGGVILCVLRRSTAGRMKRGWAAGAGGLTSRWTPSSRTSRLQRLLTLEHGYV
jgi:hypothetical protein